MSCADIFRLFCQVATVTQFLLAREGHLKHVAGCGKNAREKADEARADVGVETAADDIPEVSGKKPKWSAAKKNAIARALKREGTEPKGWSDDPRRCPFGWLYCSGVCMGLTPAEFEASKQHVWKEESDFFSSGRGAFAPTGLGNSAMPLDAALRALGMLAEGACGQGWRREPEKRKPKGKPAPATQPAAARASGGQPATFVPPATDSRCEWERASQVQAAADAFALAQLSAVRALPQKPCATGAGGVAVGMGERAMRARGAGRGRGAGTRSVGRGGWGRRERGRQGAWKHADDDDANWSDALDCSDSESEEDQWGRGSGGRQESASLDLKGLLLEGECMRRDTEARDREREEAAAEEDAVMEAIARSLAEGGDKERSDAEVAQVSESKAKARAMLPLQIRIC